MKKIVCSIITILLCFSMISCTKAPETEKDNLYSDEYMGIWYGYGTDGNEAQFKYEFTPIDKTTVSVERSGWGTNSNLDANTVVFEFISENGETSIILNYVDATETPIAQPTYIYRNSIK